MMLCRVVVGQALRLSGSDSSAHETIKGTGGTCVVGVADGSNTEFVLFDVSQAYPEYIMFYK